MQLAPPSPCHQDSYLLSGADWTVGKKKKKKKRKKKEKKRKKKERKKKEIKEKHKKENSYGKTKIHIDQKGPLIYALNLTKKGLQIFMRRI